MIYLVLCPRAKCPFAKVSCVGMLMGKWNMKIGSIICKVFANWKARLNFETLQDHTYSSFGCTLGHGRAKASCESMSFSQKGPKGPLLSVMVVSRGNQANSICANEPIVICNSHQCDQFVWWWGKIC